MKHKSQTPKHPLRPEEAQSLRDQTKECAANLGKNADEFRKSVYEFFSKGAPEALGIGEAEFRKEIREHSGGHRTTVTRNYLAGLMDVELGLPPGEVKEWALRALRKHVQKEDCPDVLEHARKEAGSHRKITARSIVSAAEKLGCLKHPPAIKAKASRSNCSSQGDENSVRSPAEDGRTKAEDTSQATEDQSEATSTARGRTTAASDRVEQILVRLKQQDRLRHELESLLDQLGIQKELLRDVAALGSSARGELLQRLEDIS